MDLKSIREIPQRFVLDNTDSLFKCDQCPASFTHKSKMTHHVETNHSMPLEISKVWSMKEPPNKHIKIPKQCEVESNINESEASEEHNSIGGAYQCFDCLMFFSTEFLLKRHNTLLHNHDRSHKCDKCPKTFACMFYLATHNLSHSGIKHICPYCPKYFRSKDNLNVHVEFHTNPRPFMCTECSKHFIKNDHLAEHVNIFHNTGGSNLFECCSQSFTTKSGLKKHEQIFHNPNATFKCNKCPKTFISVYYLREHNKDHLGTNNVCPHCHNKFKTRKELKFHIDRVHKPFKCHICGNTFMKQVHMYSHMGKKHPKSKLLPKNESNWLKFQCSICPNRYKRQNALNKHMRIHNEGFTCTFCSKGFLKKKLYRKHLDKCQNSANAAENKDSDLDSSSEPVDSDLTEVPIATFSEDTAYIGLADNVLDLLTGSSSHNLNQINVKPCLKTNADKILSSYEDGRPIKTELESSNSSCPESINTTEPDLEDCGRLNHTTEDSKANQFHQSYEYLNDLIKTRNKSGPSTFKKYQSFSH